MIYWVHQKYKFIVFCFGFLFCHIRRFMAIPPKTYILGQSPTVKGLQATATHWGDIRAPHVAVQGSNLGISRIEFCTNKIFILSSSEISIAKIVYEPKGHSAMDKTLTCHSGGQGSNPDTTNVYSAPILSGTLPCALSLSLSLSLFLSHSLSLTHTHTHTHIHT